MSTSDLENTTPNNVTPASSEEATSMEQTAPISSGQGSSLETTVPMSVNPQTTHNQLSEAFEPTQMIHRAEPTIKKEKSGAVVPPEFNGPQNTQVETQDPPAKPKRWPVIISGILLVLIVTGLAGYIGYTEAIKIRVQRQQSNLTLQAAQQYQLAMQDIETKHYGLAIRRLQAVIQLDPAFPGAKEKLADVTVLMIQATAVTPTPLPSPTPSPTPDNRAVEEMLNGAKQALANKDWNGAIASVESLRQKDAHYKAVEADGIYYMALRMRGVDKILLHRSLEGGMYDLALSERFAPLDTQAEGYRTWARMYVTGASFWGIDWPRVIEYFSQIYPSLPNLTDGSGWTAVERYRLASIKYGDKLLADEQYCDARDQYQNALNVLQDANVQAAYKNAKTLCEPPQPTDEPTPSESSTPKPTKTPKPKK
jgi:tetratricopeptide (TPR) repeat protein